MSLETAITTLTEAVQAQTALIEKSLAAAAAKTNGKAAEVKPAAKAAADKPAAKPARGKKKALTDEDVKAGFGAYLSLAADKAERQRLAVPVSNICEHFGCERISLCRADQREEAMDLLEKLNAAYEEGGVEACEALDLGLPGGEEDEDEDDRL